MRRLFALAVIALAHPAAAAGPTIEDLVGRWCGTESNYTFTRTELHVVRLDGRALQRGAVLGIAKVEENAGQITIFWKPEKPGNSTAFELTQNKRELIQQAQTTGDKGPSRIFRRC